MGEFFVDPAIGSDSNIGTSPERPWATLAKVQSALDARRVDRGDSVLFKAGSSFPGSVPLAPVGPMSERRLVLGSYGVGPRPAFVGYKWVKPAAWTHESGQVWSALIVAGSTATTEGNVAGDGDNIGHILVDGVLHARRRTSLVGLAEQWDFYTDPATSRLYVHAPDNPSVLASRIGAAPRQTGAIIRSATMLDGLSIDGFGAHGWRAVESGSIHGEVIVHDCEIQRIGGSMLSTGSRYGNGGEIWIGAEHVYDDHNTYTDIYDSAITLQGPPEGAAIAWRNVESSHARIARAGQSLEFWVTGNPTGGGFFNVRFHHGVAVNPRASWGEGVRPDTDGLAAHILTYAMEAPNIDIEIDHFTFAGDVENYRFHSTGGDRTIPPLNTHHNRILLPAGTPMQHAEPLTAEDFVVWQEETGQETGSVALIAPDVDTIGDAMTRMAYDTAFAGGVADAGFAASGRRDVKGGGALLSGRWYAVPRSSQATSNYATKDELAGQVWDPPASGLLDLVAVEVTTAGSVGAVVRAAVLELRPDLGYTLLQDLGTISAETTGVKEFTASVRVAAGGSYWIAAAIQGAGTGAVLRGAQNGLTHPLISGNTPTLVLNSNLSGLAVPGVSGTIPATRDTLIGGTTLVPVFGMRVA